MLNRASWYYRIRACHADRLINVNESLRSGTDGQMYHDTTVEYNGKTWTIDGNGVMTEAAAASEETSAATPESSASGESSAASGTTSSPTSATVSPSGGPGVTQSSGASLTAPDSK